MFCAWFESCLEELNEDYLELHPDIKEKLEGKKRIYFEDVFGKTLSKLLETSPDYIKSFLVEWEEIRNKRNSFMHGKSSSYAITQDDGKKAMDLIANAVSTFVWINNQYCLRNT